MDGGAGSMVTADVTNRHGIPVRDQGFGMEGIDDGLVMTTA
jgi:hypothetical protein